MTLGEFRKITADLSDDIEIGRTDSDHGLIRVKSVIVHLTAFDEDWGFDGNRPEMRKIVEID